jgi:hypothetical protein
MCQIDNNYLHCCTCFYTTSAHALAKKIVNSCLINRAEEKFRVTVNQAVSEVVAFWEEKKSRQTIFNKTDELPKQQCLAMYVPN